MVFPWASSLTFKDSEIYSYHMDWICTIHMINHWTTFDKNTRNMSSIILISILSYFFYANRDFRSWTEYLTNRNILWASWKLVAVHARKLHWWHRLRYVWLSGWGKIKMRVKFSKNSSKKNQTKLFNQTIFKRTKLPKFPIESYHRFNIIFFFRFSFQHTRLKTRSISV